MDSSLEHAISGEYSHAIVGVDVYASRESALAEGRAVDESRKIQVTTETTGVFPQADKFLFMSRHYRLIDINSVNDYFPASNIAELQNFLLSHGVRGPVGVLDKPVLEHHDGDTAYVLTPLSPEENGKLGLKLS